MTSNPTESVFFASPMKRLLILVMALANHNAWGQQTLGVFFNFPEAFNGYTFIAGSGSDTVYLVDNCGYRVHQWATEGTPGLATYLLENGDILRTGKVVSSIYSGGGSGGLVQKYSWEGDLLWHYQVSNPTLHQHHDVEPLPNGNVLVLNWGYLSNSQSIINGRNPATITDELWPTVIQEIEPIYPDSGIVVWEWDVSNHFIQDFDSTKLNFGVVADHPELLDINYSINGSADFLHCNAVNYNAEHDLIVMSSRKSSEIYVIDHSTTTVEAASHSGGDRGMGGDYLYRWGNPLTYDRGTVDDQMLLGPHDIHWIPDSLPDGGKFMVFNNGGGTAGSAVNVFDPQMDVNGDFPNPGANAFGPANTDWHYEEPDFASGTISGAQRLPNGNTLVCEGSPGRLFEITPTNNKVWEYVSPSSTSGNLTQGTNPIQNAMFRGLRLPVDFPAFIGKELTPGSLIEIDSIPAPCTIIPEPVGISSTTVIDDVRVVSTNGQLKIIGVNAIGLVGTIYDLSGKAIKSFNINSPESIFGIQGWSKGMYILSLKSSKNQKTFKFINQ
ncbi:MAG: hypothetical protein ACI9P8_000746 [Bacteroidia bacterium]|jgi:hypothetical protein